MNFIKAKIFIVIFFVINCGYSQQLPSYSQFTVNQLGMNPAYGGTHLGLEFWAGRRDQWAGFPGAPVQTFISGIYTFRKNFNYKAVHSVGMYVDKDDVGKFSNKSAFLFYGLHLKLLRGLKMSFGVFAGYKSVSTDVAIYKDNDPAFYVNQIKPTLYLYPNFVPGWRLYSKKMFLDVSIQNLYKNKLKQGSNHLASNSILYPQPVIMAGYRFHSPTNDFVFTPAIKVQGSIIQLPLIDLNFITYYRKRIGLGVTYRLNNSVGVMLQVRIKSNISIAIAYDYMVNNLRNYQPNSTEILFGFSPIMGTDGEKPINNRIDHCPEFDF